MNLRTVTMADAPMLLRLRNEPNARKQFRSTGTVEYSNHLQWLSDVIRDPNRTLYVVEIDEHPVATVRLDFQDGRAEISVNVDVTHRGKGIGQSAIARVVEAHSSTPIDAWIRVGNEASIKAFEATEFRLAEQADGWVRYCHG